jgi:hypothetical protein
MILGNALDPITGISRVALSRGHESENLIFACSSLPKFLGGEINGLSNHEFVRHWMSLSLSLRILMNLALPVAS